MNEEEAKRAARVLGYYGGLRVNFYVGTRTVQAKNWSLLRTPKDDPVMVEVYLERRFDDPQGPGHLFIPLSQISAFLVLDEETEG